MTEDIQLNKPDGQSAVGLLNLIIATLKTGTAWITLDLPVPRLIALGAVTYVTLRGVPVEKELTDDEKEAITEINQSDDPGIIALHDDADDLPASLDPEAENELILGFVGGAEEVYNQDEINVMCDTMLILVIAASNGQLPLALAKQLGLDSGLVDTKGHKVLNHKWKRFKQGK